jgi:putative ABC transport system permease protein
VISPFAVLREAVATARSGRVASALNVLVVAGMVVAVMLTTGRTVGAEQRVVGSIDQAGTRAIVVRADDSAGLDTDVLTRIAPIQGIEWAGSFSSAIDATNTRVPDGTRVPVRYAYGDNLALLGMPARSPLPGDLAYASPEALAQLGMPVPAGGVTLTTGPSYGIGGALSTPDFLAGFEPLVLIPQPRGATPAPVNVIVVIASRPDLVAPVATALTSVLAATDPTKVSIQTSEALANLRALVQGQLASFSRGLVLALLGLTGAIVAVILYGLVMMRRKDFGRRRALGATRGLIVALILCQTALLAVVGIAIGLVVSTAALIALRDPFPGFAFTGALSILTLLTATVAALIPAAVASRREPIKELRVP